VLQRCKWFRHLYIVRKTKLKELNKEFAIPTVRKPPPLAVATTRVCQKIEEDRHGANGPNTVQTLLALEDCLIPRCVCEYIEFISCHFLTQASGAIPLLRTIPNARFGVAVGHIYLDLATEHGGMDLNT